MSDQHFIAVSDRSAAIWEYTASSTHKISSESLSQTETIIDYGGTGFGDQYTFKAADSGKGFGRDSKNATQSHRYSTGFGDVNKIVTLKNMPDHSPLSSNTVLIQSFEQYGSMASTGLGMGRGGVQDKGVGVPTKAQHALYCVAGHKFYYAKLPIYDSNRENVVNLGGSTMVREV